MIDHATIMEDIADALQQADIPAQYWARIVNAIEPLLWNYMQEQFQEAYQLAKEVQKNAADQNQEQGVLGAR